ncbi:MAG: ATP-binding cassette domain-containing protein [Candidatus Omnitrophica bacterium]|nr:ATP-binding cassette domain-containing protein [Candidatus Omnitrophota bacterium]
MNVREVKNLKKYFPVKRGLFYKTVDFVKAVDGVSFSLEKGKTVGIVGESGSGKTTLARLVVKLLEADNGEIMLEEKGISGLTETQFRRLRKKIQIVFQDPFGSLDPRFTVEGIIEEGMRLSGGKRTVKNMRGRAMELLHMVGLTGDFLGRFPHELSGGQRQRISIARALAVEPEIIVLDEPVSSLDLSVQAQVINLLLDLQEKLNLSYIFIAHDLRVIRHVSDEICVMYKGKVMERAASFDIFENPLHPYTKLLLSSVPVLGEKRKPIVIKEEIKGAKGNGCSFFPRCSEKGDDCKIYIPELKEILAGHFAACLRIK